MENIGMAAGRALAKATDLDAPSLEPQPLSVPTTMAECEQLRAWALAQPPVRIEPVTGASLTKNIQFMEATLPYRGIDDARGEQRAAVYLGILGSYSLAAIKYLTNRACRELRWFPTPRDCLDILADYRDPPSPAATALLTCERFAHDAFERWYDNLGNGGEIGDVPQRWIDIAVTRNKLRMVDGVLTIRVARPLETTLNSATIEP